MNWVKRLCARITLEIQYRRTRRLKKLRDKDPYIYD